MDNIVTMFDILLFEYDGLCDEMEDGIQYHAINWKIPGMEDYNDKYVVVCFDGYIRIYTSEGEKLLDDSLLNIEGFQKKLFDVINKKEE